jgi:DNA-directed RNA polymerase subunit M/transcription elongation factor TFIIS
MATANVTPPSGSLAARLDGCPQCVQNTEVPYGAFEPPSGGMVALYKCTDCGHRWHTSWAATVA